MRRLGRGRTSHPCVCGIPAAVGGFLGVSWREHQGEITKRNDETSLNLLLCLDESALPGEPLIRKADETNAQALADPSSKSATKNSASMGRCGLNPRLDSTQISTSILHQSR